MPVGRYLLGLIEEGFMPAVSFSGIASGIDGDAVIKALLDARRLSTVPLKNKTEANDKENTSLEELNTKLLGLTDKLKDMLSLSGGAITKTATSSNTDALGVIAGNGAGISNATVDIQSIARAATFSFADRFSSFDAPVAPGLASSEKITFTVGSGDKALSFDVDVDSTTTIADISTQINQLAEGKLKASVVNVGSPTAPQYILLVNGTTTGAESGALSVEVSEAIKAQGIFNQSALEQARDAVFSIAGIGEIRRSSNQISDLIPGVTLELKKDNSGPVNISVASDAEKSATKVGEIISAINELIVFSKEGSKIERVEDEKGIDNLFGPLAQTRVDDQAVQAIRTAMTSTVAVNSTSTVRVLADLGITIERDGTYKFDSSKFVDAMSEDSASTEQLVSSLADQLGKTDGLISQYTRFQGNIDLAINANKTESQNIADRLTRMEANLAKQEESYKRMFANLEKTIGKLNSTSSALSGVLAGLANSNK